MWKTIVSCGVGVSGGWVVRLQDMSNGEERRKERGCECLAVRYRQTTRKKDHGANVPSRVTPVPHRCLPGILYVFFLLLVFFIKNIRPSEGTRNTCMKGTHNLSHLSRSHILP